MVCGEYEGEHGGMGLSFDGLFHLVAYHYQFDTEQWGGHVVVEHCSVVVDVVGSGQDSFAHALVDEVGGFKLDVAPAEQG
jgi:hypothetical protein